MLVSSIPCKYVCVSWPPSDPDSPVWNGVRDTSVLTPLTSRETKATPTNQLY